MNLNTNLMLYPYIFQVDLSKLRVFYLQEAPKSLANPSVQNEIKNAITEAAKFLETSCKSKVLDTCPFEEELGKVFEISLTLLANLGMDGCPDLFKGVKFNLTL